MRYKLLGRTGLRVSELCLGTMTFGEEWGWGASREESRKIFDAFADAAGTSSTPRTCTRRHEREVRRGVSERPAERFVLATKYTLSMSPDDPTAAEPPEEPGAVPRRQPEAPRHRLHRSLLGPRLDGMTPSRRRCGPWTTRCGPGRSSTSGSPTPRLGRVAGEHARGTERLEPLRRPADPVQSCGPESGAGPASDGESAGHRRDPLGVLAEEYCRGSTKREDRRPEHATRRTRFGPKRSLRNGAYGSRRRSFRSRKKPAHGVSGGARLGPRQPFGAIVPILGAKTVAQLQDNSVPGHHPRPEHSRAGRGEQDRPRLPHDFLVQARSTSSEDIPLIDDHGPDKAGSRKRAPPSPGGSFLIGQDPIPPSVPEVPPGERVRGIDAERRRYAASASLNRPARS